ncbi:hemagglutinin/amebocyte aggregation factor [Elysia marginata]|uniref:Hemagglutinin/amebocyte aggregation factor n=1 Tax=Elysia marginata TaxID=1093978 RepID=A0AAV4EKG6_9GAST|nr:hemagglutinin/amebocyte aggregation factor [Elysia marginata]
MSLAVLALVVAFAAGVNSFVNNWDQPLLYACHGGQVLRSVYSIHNNGAEDRRWRFSCGAAPSSASPNNCFWTDYVNTWDEPVSFMCPANNVIAGIQSYHNNGAEDRRTKFKCCSQSGYKTYSCSLTSYLQEFDRPLDYTVPNDKVLAGWASVHSNGAEDRRHKMLVCSYGQLTSSN